MHSCYTKKIMDSTVSAVLYPFVGFLVPKAFAQPLPTYAIDPASFGALCTLTGLCSASTPIGFGLLLTILQDLVGVIRNVFIGVCAAYLAWFALMFIVKGSEENALTENRRAFGYTAVGMGIVGVASLIVDTVAPSAVGPALVDPTPFVEGVRRIVDYIGLAVGAFLIFVISLAGARIIALQGNEAEIDKQKKNFFNGLLGMVILLLSRAVVVAIIPSALPFPFPTPVSPGSLGLVMEIAGMVKFLLELVAGLAVISLITSGFFLVISLHSDERKQRAKRILTSTVIVLLIVVLSHTLVATFIP